jgi:arginyl-tRNA synthetase
LLAAEGFEVPKLSETNLELLSSETEHELIKQLALLPEEIRLAARDCDPSRINKYVIELAARFHKFYNACRIKGENSNLLMARLKLADTTRIVIKNCLDILKVTAPGKM